MKHENFLSYLVSANRISPEKLKEIRNIQDSPQFFLLKALTMNVITKHQYQKLSTVKFGGLSSDRIGEYLVDKKVLSGKDLAAVMGDHQKDLDLLKKVFQDKGILDAGSFDSEMKAFLESPFAESSREETVPLEIFFAWSDGKYRESLSDELAADGHNVALFNDLLEASCEFEETQCDLIVLQIGEHAAEVLEMLSVLLELNKYLYAAAFTEDKDSVKLPGKLHVEKKFIFENRDDISARLKKLAHEIAVKKTRRAGVVSGDKKKKTPPPVAPTKNQSFDEMLKAVKIEYTRDGVTLFIDPDAVPRNPDRYKQSNAASGHFKKFEIEVFEFLKKKQIEKVDEKAVEVSVWYPWREPVKIAPPQEPTKNASASTALSEDGNNVLLNYDPPTGRGRHVPLDTLVQKIKQVASDFFVMENSIHSAMSSSDPVKGMPVAERRDAMAEINITPDGTRGTLILRRPYGGKPVSEKEIYARLEEMKITSGVKKQLIKEMCYSNSWDREVTIAQGVAPQNGRDGKIVFMTLEDFGNKNGNDRIVDHRVVRRMEKVSAGEQIIRVEPPEPGRPGVSVTGEQLEPKAGKEVKFIMGNQSDPDADIILGDNVELVFSGTAVVSKIEGMLRRDGKTISVAPVFEVTGDVDYSVGNIDVKGDVVIHGSVLSKFEVRATGNIHILGSVEDAIVESGGTVFIEQGIYGHEKGIIFARDAVVARCIEQANVFCKGRVSVQTNISHSNVTAFYSIETTAPDSYIVGGTLKAGRRINTFRLGSPAGTYTMMDVGSNISLEKELQDLRSYMLKKIAITERTQKQEDKEEEDDASALFEYHSPDKPPRADDKYNGMVIKSYNKYFIDWLDDFTRRGKRKTMDFRAGDDTRKFRIIVEQRTYPGVWLKMKGFGFNIKNELAGKRVFSLTGSGISESV